MFRKKVKLFGQRRGKLLSHIVVVVTDEFAVTGESLFRQIILSLGFLNICIQTVQFLNGVVNRKRDGTEVAVCQQQFLAVQVLHLPMNGIDGVRCLYHADASE